ncbi:GNAT family N-acetyltransferase [Arthrobacter glacialis]|nr:GNAT family N-acetyltransferase [Arthrobacter glacialis]
MTITNSGNPWTIKVPAEHRLHHLRKLFQKEIEGVSAKRAEQTETISRRDAYDYVPKDERGQAFPAIWLGAYNVTEHLVGALYMHTPYEELLEIGNGFDRDFAKGVGKVRRTLASIAVVEDMQRTGLGTALLTAGESQAKQEGAIWVTGFMDERNGTPEFYESNGYNIQPRNIALPKLEPFGVRELHPGYVNGQWFYKKL